MSKYHAKPEYRDGIRFASGREAKRYDRLKLLERAGEIKDLALQPIYHIRINGIKIGFYRADFKYLDVKAGQWVTEDCKGFRTPLYRFKKRLVEALYGIAIKET